MKYSLARSRRRDRLLSRFTVLPATALAEFPKVESPRKGSRILFLAPHPDDEALAAGGYLAAAVRAGAACKVVLITDGNRRGLKDVRAQEFSNVLEALGIPDAAVRLDFANGGIGKKAEDAVRQAIAAAVVSFDPTVVIAPHPADLHGEHRLTSSIARALHEIASFELYEYLIHYPPRYPWPRAYAPAAPLLPPPNLLGGGGAWKAFALDPKAVERKKDLVELYASQLKTPVLRSLMYALIRRNELFHVFARTE